MASTYSPSLRIELIGTGDQSGIWGDTTNNNLGGLIEQAITGVETIPMLDADYTLTALNGSVDEARNVVIIMTSSVPLTGSRNIIIPAAEKLYIIKNSTTGGQNLNVTTSGGAGYTVPNGQTAFIYCDGTDCFQSISHLNSPAFTGTPTAPTAAYGTNTTQLATTAFVQAALQALYPVGSVYINASNATNPATLFGFGTWVTVGDGRVLVNQDTTDTSFDVLGETGGSKDATVVSHTHTATSTSTSTTSITDPGHTHTSYQPNSKGLSSGGDPNGVWGGGTGYLAATTSATTGISASTTTNTSTSIAPAGSSGTNANLQPYVVVKMWKRTA